VAALVTLATALCDMMAAEPRYLSTHGQEVWVGLRYLEEGKVLRRSVLPSGWLK